METLIWCFWHYNSQKKTYTENVKSINYDLIVLIWILFIYIYRYIKKVYRKVKGPVTQYYTKGQISVFLTKFMGAGNVCIQVDTF